MKAQVINSQHCIEVDGHHIEICYYFQTNEMTVFIDGDYMLKATYTPARVMINYTNLLDVAATMYESWKRKQDEKNKIE